jgi:hypothetical protein
MDSYQQDLEISPEEREQVLRQIEAAIAGSRAPGGPELAVVLAERRGVLFPLLINLAALALIAAGVFLLLRYFELRKENITLRRTSYISAEGTVIQTLKEETESRLQAKEEEIAAIQRRLRQVDEERQALALEVEANLQTREEQLRGALEAELSRERNRLAALGTSEVMIIDRLRELETRQQGSIEREIADYRQELILQLEAKEQELLEAQERSREALSRANRDRDQLLQALRAQASERSAAEQRLNDLNARMQAESAAVDELEAELAARSERIEELEGQIRAIVAASATDRSRDALLAEQLQGRVDDLNAEVARLATAARSLRAERDALAVSLQSARAAQSTVVEQGRDAALRDVMTFLRYLSEGGETDTDTENRLLSLARQDPLFRAATREMQILIAGGGPTGAFASPFSFLGIVSSVGSGRAVIEAMVDLDVPPGAVIQIRRISELDREIAIAEGTVLQVRGAKITAAFKPIDAEAGGPAVRDPVYVVLQER